MYCISCGNEIQTALNFCNRCGGKIEKVEAATAVSNFQSIATSITVIGLGGMVAIVILTLKLLKEGVDIGAIIPIIGMFLLTILAITFMVIRLMPRFTEKSIPNEIAKSEYEAPRNLSGANTSRLEAPKDFPASVVEETTRTLDEVLLKKH